MRTIEQMVQSEVMCCMSSIVATLAQASGCTVSGTRARKDNEARQLSELADQAFELACPVPDYEEAAIQAGWELSQDNRFPCARSKTAAERAASTEDDGDNSPCMYADNAEDACAIDGIDPYEWEVYEHWAVTQWFADKLAAAGEKVDNDFGGLCIWARTTTGQAISMDGVVQRIYAELMKAT